MNSSSEANEVERLLEAWGDWVDPRSYLNDTSGFGYSGVDGRVSVASDRQDGDNPPFWQSEQEHAEIRGICRFLAQVDEVGVGAIRTLTDYVVGWGAKENWSGDPSLAKAAEREWNRIADAEGLRGTWEREWFARKIRDGERCAWVHADGGEILIDLIEPEFITQPGTPRTIEDYYGLDAYDWKYGVATTLNRPTRWHGLYASFFGSATDWEWLPKRDIVWTKANVDAAIKRGVSDIYPVFRRMEQGSKLLTNTLQGGAIQAAIAYIREHAPGTSASGIASVRGSDDTRSVPNGAGGSKTVRVQKFMPGTVVDVSSGLKYTAGPVGSGAGAGFLQLAQAAMRLVGIRWAMPEYLISGDASNGNYSSTLVAEAPFTKSTEAMQAIECCDRRELIWKVLDKACQLGRFRRFGIESVDQLRSVVDVEVTLPPVAVRNRVEDAQVAEIEKRNGVLSAQTWAEDAGRDYAEEINRGARDATIVAAPATEVANEEPVGDVAADGEVLKPQDTALNGAQVQAAVTIVQSVAAGTLPRDAGLGQLQIMFNLSPQEAETIMGSVGIGFEPEKTPPLAVSEAKKYSHIDFTPPEGVRDEAAKGLEWRREHGRGGTAVGVARARDLSNGTEISPETAKRMYSYFARHEVDKKGEGWSPKQDGFPSAGRIAWALWGGDAGEAWASKLVRQMAAADDEVSEGEVESLTEALARCWKKYP